MNPSIVARNAQARRTAIALAPVYSTVTPPAAPRAHRVMVEIEDDYGHRSWKSMLDTAVDAFLADLPASYELSDIDCSTKCWCQAA